MTQAEGGQTHEGRALPPEAAKRAFLAHVRHELRTPIGAIIGYSEMLLEEPGPCGSSACQQHLKETLAGGQKLLAVVNDVLDPVRIEASAEGPEAFSHRVCSSLRAPLEGVMLACEAMIREAEFSADDSPAFPVQTRAQAQADLHRIRDAARKLLSLILAPDLSLLDGDAAYQSLVEGRDPGAAAMAEEAIASIPSPNGSSTEPAPERGEILVVDDNDVNRDMLSRLLQRQGHDVAVAESGSPALDLLAKQPFDLVLLDIMMPGMNGYQVLQRIKSDESLKHIPVVMISALDEIDSVVHCIELGAEDYLPKPFNPVLLKARVNASLEKSRLRAAEQQYTVQLEQRVEAAAREIMQKTRLLERRVREVSAMIDLSTAIISVLDVNVLLQQIMELSKEVMGAEASSLLVLDKEIGKLRFYVAHGTAGKTLESATVELGHGIAGWVARSGEPLLIADAYKDPRFDATFDRKTGFRTRSILTVPVKIKGEVTGVVQVINKKGHAHFDEHDLQLFQSFASMASISLENARLFEETRDMAEKLRTALEAERRLSIEKEKMGAYVPKQVVDEISRNREQTLALGGKTICITILFSDIQAFTRLSEHMEPQEVVSFLNEYMTAMADIIYDEGGVVDKFIGDGIMAEFLESPEHPDHHALRAVRAGIRMQKALATLQEQWVISRPGVAHLKTRIGINTGEVVAGNIGSQTRMDYTVIGDNVNVASRIESNGSAGRVYVSESTYAVIKDQIPAQRMEPISVKNRVQPVQIYAVLP